jgi:hypothetical protein
VLVVLEHQLGFRDFHAIHFHHIQNLLIDRNLKGSKLGVDASSDGQLSILYDIWVLPNLIDGDARLRTFAQEALEQIERKRTQMARPWKIDGLYLFIEFLGVGILKRDTATQHCIEHYSTRPDICLKTVIC